jgi:hypothetical protein
MSVHSTDNNDDGIDCYITLVLVLKIVAILFFFVAICVSDYTCYF